MNKILTVIITIIIIFFAFKAIKDTLPISKSITKADDYVTIHYGDMFIKAKMKPEAISAFLVNNGFEGKKSDGWFWVIPMEQANTLKATYGDFVHCDSAGASAAKDNLQMLVLFTVDQQIREKIGKVIKRSLNLPVIEIRGSKLDIEEQTIRGEKYTQFDLNTPENYYLIEDIRIKQEHYR